MGSTKILIIGKILIGKAKPTVNVQAFFDPSEKKANRCTASAALCYKPSRNHSLHFRKKRRTMQKKLSSFLKWHFKDHNWKYLTAESLHTNLGHRVPKKKKNAVTG